MSTTQTDVTPTEAITLTDAAASKVAELIEQEGNPDLALRVAVRPGGCSGFSYEMFFDTDVADDDHDLACSGRSRWSWTRPAPACCRAQSWTSRTGCRAPGSASTTPTPAAPAAAGSPSAELTAARRLRPRRATRGGGERRRIVARRPARGPGGPVGQGRL